MLFNEDFLQHEIKKELGIRVRVAISRETIADNRLTPRELQHLKEFEASPRLDSWLRGRSAFKRLLAYFGENEDTSDISFPNSRFSLTHSGDYAVAVGTDSPQLLGIGIDLEVNRLPHPESARFFLSPAESGWVTGLEETVRPMDLLRLWTIKEAVYKSDPDNHRRGLVDYMLEDPRKRSGRTFVPKEKSPEIRYACFPLEHGFLSLAILPKDASL